MATNLVLSKDSSESEIKAYFNAVLKLSQSNNEFPINLDEVWMLVYSEKGKDKHFKSITESALTYGENQVNPNNTKETQPLWYKEKFNELLMLLDFKLVEAL
jgi:hypothetical protein